MASVLTVYKTARVPPLLTTMQDSFPAGGQPLPGGIGYPPGLVEEFQLGASPPPGLIPAPHASTHPRIHTTLGPGNRELIKPTKYGYLIVKSSHFLAEKNF
jgi:hypothetical protein